LHYLFGRNNIAFDWLRNRENLSFYRAGENRGRGNDMNPDGIADSYSNTSVGAENFYLKEVGKKAAEMAEKEAIQNVLQETHWNRKEAAKVLHISYKALLYKIKKYFSNEQKAAKNRNNYHENWGEMRWDGE
jgi:DNA-binding NtrC family response regulator